MTDPVPTLHPDIVKSDVPWRMAEHWPELVGAITQQSVESVGLLLRGLELLKQRGRITPAEYQVLALPAERLKQCGIHAQQIIRFQSGQARQSHEKIDLAYLVETVLQERRSELTLMGLTVRRKFMQTDVLIDPTLGYSLTQAMLEWSIPHGHRIDLRLDLDTQNRAQLWMKTYTEQPPIQSKVFEDNIQWLLLNQIAHTDGGIDVQRHTEDDGVVLQAQFKRTLKSNTPVVGLDHITAESSTVFKSVSGAYVLVCSAHSDTRLQALTIVRKLGITADGVASGTQAVQTLQNREVHLLVLDEEHPPADALRLHEELAASHPLLPVVRIGPVGMGNNDRQRPVIARDMLAQQLGSTVMFTLSHVM